jgi:FkbM family methyltransferase
MITICIFLISLHPLLAKLFNNNVLLIDIGCYNDPIRPPNNDNNVKVLAFEPNLDTISKIIPHPNLYIIPAAVSYDDTLSKFNFYNDGLSNSINEAHSSSLFIGNSTGLASIVPTLSLASILNSIDDTTDIVYMKTDIQGEDFKALKSAGTALTRIPFLKTEVSFGNYVIYNNATNDFCRHVYLYMDDLGYDAHYLEIVNQRYPHTFADTIAFCKYDVANGPKVPIVGMWEGNVWWKLRNYTARTEPGYGVFWP